MLISLKRRPLSSRLSRSAALVLTWLLASGQCCQGGAAQVSDQHRTFYVDSEHGRDSNNGRSQEAAWRSLDQVNQAELQPGDTVRFRSGGVWRGSLFPASGSESAPITYTSYGQGSKPLILGSLPRHRPEDWIRVKENLWATLPIEYQQGKPLLDLRGSSWGRHQEAGAKVGLSQQKDPGARFFRLTCDNSGRSANHVQIWGPQLAVTKGTCLQLAFRARSTKPFRLPGMTIRQAGSPWTAFATATATEHAIGTDWQVFSVIFRVWRSAEKCRLHLYLGGILPAGAVFDFQPQTLHEATASVPDPPVVDVGNIIFDHGKVCGWKKWTVEALEKPYDYYYDPSWRVFLCAPANPATLHESIELALARHVVNQSGVHHVIYDGLAIKYGAAHGFGGGGTHHLVIRNCDLGYIGGAHQFTRNGHHVRYGNAIEFWGAAHDHLVEGCRIWEVYDAALTNQGRGPGSKQINITYRNNVIRNAEYSFEYWNNPETALTRNIRFVNNTCVNAGTVWSHAQRPNQNGSHLMFYSNTAVTSGIEIKYNVFCNVTEWGSRYERGWKPLPDMDYNLWFTNAGVMTRWFGKKVASFEDYRKVTGLDAHSLFADPQFLDAAKHDYRLAPDSPAHKIRSDGGPMGAVMAEGSARKSGQPEIFTADTQDGQGGKEAGTR